jgi:hypothetical protein
MNTLTHQFPLRTHRRGGVLLMPALLAAVLALAGCGSDDEQLPAQVAGKAQVLETTDADYGRAVITSAVKPAGQGGVSEGTVIRLTQDIAVYRLWSGPAKVNAAGLTNRIGGWWSYDAPRGTQAQYRSNYEICNGWNDLTWVAKCTLKAGAVVVIGPGQSVSAETCGDPTGKESYAANSRDWQLYIDKPWTRPTELVCPDAAQDYEADPNDISKAKSAS